MAATTAASDVSVVILAFSVLATVLVGLRAISRFAILKKARVDDYFCIVALAFAWGISALGFLELRTGSGQHIYRLPANEVQGLVKYIYITIPVHNLGLSFAKLSALFQFLRFFTTPRTRMTTWILIVIVCLYGTTVPITSIFQCRPIAAFWNRGIGDAKCIDLAAFAWTIGSLNLIMDVAIVALPMYVLKDLQLPRKQKLAVIGIFAVAGFTCVTAGMRLNAIGNVVRSQDITYYNVDALLWAAIELDTSIMCACMPALRPLIVKVVPKWLSSNDSTQTTHGNSDSSAFSQGKSLLHLQVTRDSGIQNDPIVLEDWQRENDRLRRIRGENVSDI